MSFSFQFLRDYLFSNSLSKELLKYSIYASPITVAVTAAVAMVTVAMSVSVMPMSAAVAVVSLAVASVVTVDAHLSSEVVATGAITSAAVACHLVAPAAGEGFTTPHDDSCSVAAAAAWLERDRCERNVVGIFPATPCIIQWDTEVSVHAGIVRIGVVGVHTHAHRIGVHPHCIRIHSVGIHGIGVHAEVRRIGWVVARVEASLVGIEATLVWVPAGVVGGVVPTTIVAPTHL